MNTGGLSKARLGRMREVMARHVERGAVPGVVTGLSRRGEVHVDAVGAKTVGGEPIQRDTIVRIASMTKPVGAVAAMILVEQCALRLDEPVDDLLPELANRRVLRRLDGPLDDTVPPTRPITLRDLLTFRMGIGLLMAPPDAYPILRAMIEQKVDVGPIPSAAAGPDAWMRGLGALPLMRQPGETWLYHTGSEVLGVLIARASGRPLEAFLRERIFDRRGRERILSRPTVEAMIADQLTAEQKAGSALVPGYWDTHGWGLGVAMITGRDGPAAVPGRFGWDGGYGTSWGSDPAEGLVAVLLTQRLWTSPDPPAVYADFWTSAYQAIDD